MKKKIKYSSYFFGLVIFLLLIGLGKTFSYMNDYRKEIRDLRLQLSESKEIHELSDYVEKFIRESSVGNQSDFLTGIAKEEYEEALRENGFDEDHHEHGVNTLDNVEVKNVFVKEVESNEAKAYAIYSVTYNLSSDNDMPNNQQILIFSLTANLVKSNGSYKINKYKIDLLQDSLDQYLKEMSEKTIEKK